MNERVKLVMKECLIQLVGQPSQELVDELFEQDQLLNKKIKELEYQQSADRNRENQEIEQKNSESSSDNSITPDFTNWLKDQHQNNQKVAQQNSFDNLQCSLALQLFSVDELKNMHPENLLLLQLIEVGNTLDSVIVSAKIIKTLNIDEEPAEKTDLSPTLEASPTIGGTGPNGNSNGQLAQAKAAQKKQINSNFIKFQQWKKRKCHCCMEPILDAGKAIICVNVVR